MIIVLRTILNQLLVSEYAVKAMLAECENEDDRGRLEQLIIDLNQCQADIVRMGL